MLRAIGDACSDCLLLLLRVLRLGSGTLSLLAAIQRNSAAQNTHSSIRERVLLLLRLLCLLSLLCCCIHRCTLPAMASRYRNLSHGLRRPLPRPGFYPKAGDPTCNPLVIPIYPSPSPSHCELPVLPLPYLLLWRLRQLHLHILRQPPHPSPIP